MPAQMTTTEQYRRAVCASVITDMYWRKAPLSIEEMKETLDCLIERRYADLPSREQVIISLERVKSEKGCSKDKDHARERKPREEARSLILMELVCENHPCGRARIG